MRVKFMFEGHRAIYDTKARFLYWLFCAQYEACSPELRAAIDKAVAEHQASDTVAAVK